MLNEVKHLSAIEAIAKRCFASLDMTLY